MPRGARVLRAEMSLERFYPIPLRVERAFGFQMIRHVRASSLDAQCLLSKWPLLYFADSCLSASTSVGERIWSMLVRRDFVGGTEISSEYSESGSARIKDRTLRAFTIPTRPVAEWPYRSEDRNVKRGCLVQHATCDFVEIFLLRIDLRLSTHESPPAMNMT